MVGVGWRRYTTAPAIGINLKNITLSKQNTEANYCFLLYEFQESAKYFLVMKIRPVVPWGKRLMRNAELTTDGLREFFWGANVLYLV